MLQGKEDRAMSMRDRAPWRRYHFYSRERLKVVHTLSQSLYRSIHLVSRRLGTGHEYLV